MSGQSILIIDDEPDLRELVRYNLNMNGFVVLEADNGKTGLDMICDQRPSLVILDLMLPGLSGLDVCRSIRRNPVFDTMPIIMLTAIGEDHDVVLGLELGANDYMTKPFSPKVLLARIRAVLRHSAEASPIQPSIQQGRGQKVSRFGILIDPERHSATLDGAPLNLSPSEFSILQLLLSSPGRLFSREKIISTVKGDDYPVTNRSVDVHILNLRKKLGHRGNVIETVRGLGYRLKDVS